jgi:hypothetical protein
MADEKKVLRIMGVVTAPFTMGKDRHYVSSTALRLGMEQRVYATMLYEAAIQDVNYDKMQQVGVIRRCRQLLHLRSITPTAYIMWELRLWPARLRARKRAQMLMSPVHLFFTTWLGKRILQPYLREDARRDGQAKCIHPTLSLITKGPSSAFR